MGGNFSDTEENSQAETHYRESLQMFIQLESEEVRPYLNYIQEIYNIYGLLSINREDNEMGLAFLGKSNELYNTLLELPECASNKCLDKKLNEGEENKQNEDKNNLEE